MFKVPTLPPLLHLQQARPSLPFLSPPVSKSILIKPKHGRSSPPFALYRILVHLALSKASTSTLRRVRLPHETAPGQLVLRRHISVRVVPDRATRKVSVWASRVEEVVPKARYDLRGVYTYPYHEIHDIQTNSLKFEFSQNEAMVIEVVNLPTDESDKKTDEVSSEK
jgi:hypothetical protein